MSVLGLMESSMDTGQTAPELSAQPSTNTERFGASWNAAQTDDRYWNVQAARKTRADKIIDDLHAMTGERLKNPYDNAPTTDEIRENLGQPTTVIYAKRLENLRTATRNAKAGLEQLGGLPQDYLDVDSIDADIASQSGAARARDERMSGTGGGFGGFLGSMAGETVSPHGIMTSFIPVTRMGGAVAEAGVAAFARNVAKEALFQGGTQGAAQSLATIVDFNTRKQFGTEQTNEQILEEIISAAAGGALLGGAFRAAHLGILKLASRGVEIPPAALDSARVMEERDLYGNKNPLRITPAQMEVATDQATSAAALGRAASPDVDVSGVPTLHDAARRLEPELMQRYDAAVAWRDEARAILAPTDETIAMLKKRMDAADEAIKTAGPQTGEAAERLGATARMARLIHDDAVERKAAMGGGEAPALPPVPEGMVRMFHGGDNATAGGERHVAATFEYARDYNQGKPVWYVDVPADSPWLKDVDVSGTNMPRQIMNSVAPEEVMAGAKRVPEPGAATETTVSQSMRQQAQMADLELRDLIPEINKVMMRAGEEVTAATRAAEAARAQADTFLSDAAAADTFARVESKLSPEDISRVRELQEQIPEYERMRDAASPEDAPAWQQAIDDFNTELAKIMDLDVADQAPVRAAMAKLEAVPTNPMQAPRPPPPEPKAQPTTAKAPGESAEDKAVLQQAKQIVDSETLAKVDPEARRKMELIDVEEREYKAAVACVAGVL